MSKGSNTTTQNTSSSGSVSPTPEAFQAYQALLQRAGSVSQTPFSPYQGPEVAGISDTSQGAIDQAKGWASGFAPLNPAGIINDAGQWVTGNDISQYMDPWTQQVIDATQRDFDVQNQRASSVTAGNAASIGALGGNSTAVAKALTQEGQERVQAPIIAGLRSQGFSNAEQMANMQKARQLQSGQALSSGEQAAIGTQAALGTQEQQTQQAQFTQQMTDYYMQQGYPFATAQWLAAITLGAGSQMGSTSTGQGTSVTQGPQPNQYLQGAGLGLTALAAYSDERLKEDVKEIGRLHDGQKIYRYRFKGDPQVHVGMLSQEVEKHHPEAVHNISGFGAVDYDRATADAVKKWSGGSVRGFAPGGAPQLGATPYGASSAGWVPVASLPGVAPMQAPSLPKFADPKIGDPNAAAMGQIGKGLGSMKGLNLSEGFGKIGSGISDFLGMGSGAGTDFNPMGWGFNGPTTTGVTGAYNSGGSVPISAGFAGGIEMPRGLATGGIPSDDDYEVVDATDLPPITYNPSAPKDASEAIASKLIKNDPAGPGDAPPPSSAYASEDPNDERPATTSVRYAQVRQPGVAGAAPTATDASPAMPGGPASPVEPQSSGFGFRMSDEARQGLISMGLAMMGNRVGGKGSFLAGVGDAGAQGMNTYGQARNATIAQDAIRRKEQFEREKFERPYQQMTIADRLKAQENMIKAGQEKLTIVPGVTTKSGHPIAIDKTRPNDPPFDMVTRKPLTEEEMGSTQTGGWKPYPGMLTEGGDPVMKNNQGQLMNATTQELLAPGTKLVDSKNVTLAGTSLNVRAFQLASGDPKSAYGGLSFRDSKAKQQVYDLAIKNLTDAGMSDEEAAKYMSAQTQAFHATGMGLSAEARTAGTREANLKIILKATDGAIPAALELSKEVSRVGFVPLDKILVKGKINSNNPDEIKFGMANLQLAEHWARAMNPTGQMRESDRDLALEFLSTAHSQEAYEASIMQLKKQIDRELYAVSSVKNRGGFDAKLGETTTDQAKKELAELTKGGGQTGAGRTPVRSGTVKTGPNAGKIATEYSDGTIEYK